MMIQTMSTSLSGLLQFQKGIQVTSNNVANVNTEGYTKQRINFSTTMDIKRGGQQVGTGVTTQNITRMHDELLWSSLKNSSSSNSEATEYSESLELVRNQLVSEKIDGENITSMVDGWFNKLEDLADNPESESIKSDLKLSGEAIFDRKNMLIDTLNEYTDSLKEKRTLLVEEANGYVNQLDGLSHTIRGIEAGNELSKSQNYANDLRDKRDNLEKKLSDIGNFDAFKDKVSNGKYNVSDKGIDYDFKFAEDGGRLAGIDKALKSIESLKNKFNDAFEPVANKIEEFITSDMENPNEVLQWNYDNNPSKNIGDEYVKFSSEVDVSISMMQSTESTMNVYLEQHNQLSKVNLDEEMMKMMMYQRQYEANAKMITTADSMLGTAIDMKR